MRVDDPMVAALLRELDGYRRTGRHERAALVEEQLKLRGWQPETPQPEATPAEVPKRTATERPKGRQTPPKSTTSAS